MLVLSRKMGESIRIGSDVEVVVLGISGGRVRLGFAGPRSVSVQRAELLTQESNPPTLPTVLSGRRVQSRRLMQPAERAEG